VVEPAVIPLDCLGVVDIEGANISHSELLAHALFNSTQENQLPEDFTIRRGSVFVNEYARVDPSSGIRYDGGPSNPNHLLGSFPTLFPYGTGGFEVERPLNVSYESHARWALMYHDRRFRKDPQFPFQIFGVCQKRQVCRSAVLQMKRSTYARHREMITNLTPADLIKASEEETRGVLYSNPGVRALRTEIRGIRSRITGTDESRTSIRSEIWGNNLLFNPPALWITMNPPDTQDPIAQVLAGAEINLDQFCNTAGPDHTQRALNIASDPYASAQYFHFMIRTLLEVVFGIRASSGRIMRQPGAFGTVQAYIGTVEAQGRSTLHLHLLVWLKDAPSTTEMKVALKSPAYRAKIQEFISRNIRADIDNMTTPQISKIPKIPGVSYSRPIDPLLKPMESEVQEKQLARAVQLHKCSLASCLKSVNGRLECKRRAPWPIAEADWVNEMGAWGPKRTSSYLNSWCPTIMRTLRANHDIKLIMNGAETCSLVWYITNYATKKQQRSSNISALLAKKLAFHQKLEKGETDLINVNKRLIQRCANALAMDREFSVPEIISYLMGWGDRYESHFYATFYWDNAVWALKRAYPGLHERRYGSHK